MSTERIRLRPVQRAVLEVALLELLAVDETYAPCFPSVMQGCTEIAGALESLDETASGVVDDVCETLASCPRRTRLEFLIDAAVLALMRLAVASTTPTTDAWHRGFRALEDASDEFDVEDACWFLTMLAAHSVDDATSALVRRASETFQARY